MVEKDSTSITVSWQPIFGELSGYKIKYRKASYGQYAYMETSHWKSEGKISDLEKNTAYVIQVAAYSEDGIGPYSERIVEKTENGKYL